jgi:hypothetical protein
MSGRGRIDKTVWVEADELAPGLRLKFRYIPKTELQEMVRRATDTTFNRQANQKEARVNPDKLLREYAGAILDWEGMSRETYARLIPIDPADYPEAIPCTEEYKLELLREAYGFEVVATRVTTDLAMFQAQELEREIKN